MPGGRYGKNKSEFSPLSAMDSKVVNETERALVEATQKPSAEKRLNVPLVAHHVRAIQVGGSGDIEHCESSAVL